MFHGHLGYFEQPPLGGGPNTKPGDHGAPNVDNHRFILFIVRENLREHKPIELAFG